MANMGGMLPFLLLSGGTSLTTVLLIALMQNEGLLNNLLGFASGDEGDDTASTPQAPGTNIYDVAKEEVAATGSISPTTAEVIQRQSETDAQTAVAEAERDARLAEAEAERQSAIAETIEAQNKADDNLKDAAIVGGVGGAVAGGLLGAQIGFMGGPIGAVGGAGIGAVLGALGLVSATSANDSGDWWPFW